MESSVGSENVSAYVEFRSQSINFMTVAGIMWATTSEKMPEQANNEDLGGGLRRRSRYEVWKQLRRR